jgi:uncharacterized protein YndB with AHSA1/START domain
MVKHASPSEALLLQRRLPVPPEKIFEAFTDPKRLSRWFAPMEEMRTVVHELEPRVGGSYRLDMVAPNGDAHKLSGVYQELRKPDLLVFTWRWEGSPEETLVRIELRPVKGGCELLLTHERFLTAASKKEHGEGWEGCLARLPAVVSG